MQQTHNDRKNHKYRCCQKRQEVEEEITDSEVRFNRGEGREGGKEERGERRGGGRGEEGERRGGEEKGEEGRERGGAGAKGEVGGKGEEGEGKGGGKGTQRAVAQVYVCAQHRIWCECGVLQQSHVMSFLCMGRCGVSRKRKAVASQP